MSTLDSDQNNRVKLMSNVSWYMISMYREYCTLLEKGIPYEKRIHYQSKHNKENGTTGQYGYYISSNASEIDSLLSKYQIKSFLDLGSGAGVLLGVLNIFNKDINFNGYDIEESLLSYSSRCFPSVGVTNKDILTLKPSDVTKYDALYFWEPFAEEVLAKKFVDNLAKIVRKGQYIFYQPSGSIRHHLKAHPHIKEISDKYSWILVYQVQ